MNDDLDISDNMDNDTIHIVNKKPDVDLESGNK